MVYKEAITAPQLDSLCSFQTASVQLLWTEDLALVHSLAVSGVHLYKMTCQGQDEGLLLTLLICTDSELMH